MVYPPKRVLDQLSRTSDLLIDVNESLRAILGAVAPRPKVAPMPTPTTVPYSEQVIPLDTALTNHEVNIAGEFLGAWTDGDLTNIAARFNSTGTDLHYLIGGVVGGVEFNKVLITSPAQAGKKLYLFAGRDGAYVTLTKLAVDIVAQAIASIKIDIASQSIGNLAVNIAASAITLQVNIASQTANINVNVAASAVTLNVNISSQSANMSVNIAASAITLQVNIASTSANIGVDIKAQTVGNIGVSIAAQTVGSLTIKIGAAQTVSIDTFRDWNTTQGNQKHLTGSATCNGSVAVTYTVTAGKTLYVTEWSFGGPATCTNAALRKDGVATLQFIGPSYIPPALSTPLPCAAGVVVDIILYGTGGTGYANLIGVEI